MHSWKVTIVTHIRSHITVEFTNIFQVLATIAFVFAIVTGLEVSIRDVNSSLQHTKYREPRDLRESSQQQC